MCRSIIRLKNDYNYSYFTEHIFFRIIFSIIIIFPLSMYRPQIIDPT